METSLGTSNFEGLSMATLEKKTDFSIQTSFRKTYIVSKSFAMMSNSMG